MRSSKKEYLLLIVDTLAAEIQTDGLHDCSLLNRKVPFLFVHQCTEHIFRQRREGQQQPLHRVFGKKRLFFYYSIDN